MKISPANEIRLGLLTVLLGAFCGAVVWLFLRVLGICTGFIWETIPAKAGFTYLPVLICAFLPLVFGASAGPEAGLTGIIAAALAGRLRGSQTKKQSRTAEKEA